MVAAIPSFGAKMVAHNSFQKARNRATWRQLFSFFTPKRLTLNDFNEDRRTLRIAAMSDLGIREINIAAIRGSVNRTRDFTANFLPLSNRLLERWTRIQQAMERMEPLPPIEVYKVKEFYYVIDGHHRVSVAKWMGLRDLPAHVIELQTVASEPNVL